MRRRRLFLLAILVLTTVASPGWATNVRIATNVGNIDLELFDADRPITVANFLSYVNDGSYANSFSHRLIPGFVIQGGGFRLDGLNVEDVPTKAAITNEFNGDARFTNAYGTITMAKVDGDVNSATSQWFINLKNNNTGTAETGNLDLQNGGFTVFGRVKAGWEVLELLNGGFGNGSTGGRGIYDASSNLGGPFNSLPLLVGALEIQNLITTRIFVLPPPSLAVNGTKTRRTKKSFVVLSGTATVGTDVISWQVGKGKSRTVAGATTWRIKATGLKRGRNVVTIRGLANVGVVSGSNRVTIMRW